MKTHLGIFCPAATRADFPHKRFLALYGECPRPALGVLVGAWGRSLVTVESFIMRFRDRPNLLLIYLSSGSMRTAGHSSGFIFPGLSPEEMNLALERGTKGVVGIAKTKIHKLWDRIDCITRYTPTKVIFCPEQNDCFTPEAFARISDIIKSATGGPVLRGADVRDKRYLRELQSYQWSGVDNRAIINLEGISLYAGDLEMYPVNITLAEGRQLVRKVDDSQAVLFWSATLDGYGKSRNVETLRIPRGELVQITDEMIKGFSFVLSGT